MSSRDRLYKK